MKITSCAIALSATALLLTACADVEQDGRVVSNDAGTLCMFADEPLIPGLAAEDTNPQAIEAGRPLVVTVALDECLSASCDIARQAHCSVDLVGSPLVVRSELVDEMGDGGSWTRDCGRLVASCQGAPLAAGAYTVLFGDASYPLAVPSTLPASCR